jgi:hypothetical protein
MLEALGDMWRMESDALCITTNSVVKRDGRAVMGKGCALQAKRMFRDVDVILGRQLTLFGNHVFLLSQDPVLFSFPVKYDWKDKADIELILRSCDELMEAVDSLDRARATEGLSPLQRVLLPRPGCGAGALVWTDVHDRIAPRLDNRFIIVSY